MSITDQCNAENKYNLCVHEDEFIRNKYEGETRWIVVLSNGLSVYQDDDRPDIHPPSAWERLHNYCKETGNYPVNMRIQFRSHTESLPENAEGYYFVKSVLGEFGSNRTWHFFVTGVLENGIIKVNKWKVPELIPTEYEEREVKLDDVCLIRKNT
jgi:hypothetical protein